MAEHDNAVIAPKLLAKAQVMAENSSAEAVFKVRGVPAQIGRLETCVPVVQLEPSPTKQIVQLPAGRRVVVGLAR